MFTNRLSRPRRVVGQDQSPLYTEFGQLKHRRHVVSSFACAHTRHTRHARILCVFTCIAQTVWVKKKPVTLRKCPFIKTKSDMNEWLSYMFWKSVLSWIIWYHFRVKCVNAVDEQESLFARVQKSTCAKVLREWIVPMRCIACLFLKS